MECGSHYCTCFPIGFVCFDKHVHYHYRQSCRQRVTSVISVLFTMLVDVRRDISASVMGLDTKKAKMDLGFALYNSLGYSVVDGIFWIFLSKSSP